MNASINNLIQRPALPTSGYTSLPNWLFDCETFELKARDSTVLNYLLTKCKTWEIRIHDIAKHCRMSRNTVYAALKVLQERGLVWWVRLSSGHVKWYVHVPDNPPPTRMVEPHPKKSDPKKSDPNLGHVLTKNNKKPITENTTNPPPESPPSEPPPPPPPVVVSEPVVQEAVKTETPADNVNVLADYSILQEQFDDKQRNLANKELNRVNLIAQAVILFTLKTTIASNSIKNSPMALLRSLVNKAIEGTLDTQSVLEKMKKTGQYEQTPPPQPSMPQQKPFSSKEYHSERNKKLPALVAKYPHSLEETIKTGQFYFPGEGMFILADFVEAGFNIERQYSTQD